MAGLAKRENAPADFRVTVRVRNNAILEAIEAKGYRTVGGFCRATGVDRGTIDTYVRLKRSPVKSDGVTWTEGAERLARALDTVPEVIFSEAHFEAHTQNVAERRVNAEEMFALMSQTASNDPAAILEDKELSAEIDSALRALPARSEEVLRLRFEDGLTLDGVGLRLGVGKERVRQIEAKALRLLRAPNRSKSLRDWGDPWPT